MGAGIRGRWGPDFPAAVALDGRARRQGAVRIRVERRWVRGRPASAGAVRKRRSRSLVPRAARGPWEQGFPGVVGRISLLLWLSTNGPNARGGVGSPCGSLRDRSASGLLFGA